MGRRRYREKHHCHGEDGPGPERRSGHGAYGYPTYCHPEGPSDRCPSTSPSTDDSPWADTHSYSRAYGGAGSDTLPNLHSSAHGNPCGDRYTCSDRNAGTNGHAGTNGNTGTYGPGSTDCDSGAHRYARPYGHASTNGNSFTHGHAGVYGDSRAHSHAGTYGDACSCPNRLAGTDGDTCAYGHASPHGHAGSDRYTCAYRSLRKSTSDY